MMRSMCGCGCGVEVSSTRAKFISGHNSRVMFRSEEHRRHIGEALRNRYAEQPTKVCGRCGVEKPKIEYRHRASGACSSYCRPCEAVSGQEWREQNPVKAKRIAERARLYVEHGLREEDYAELLANQGGKCAICATDNPGKNRSRFLVDHCHRSKEIRGLLCDSCNRAIGMLGDEVERIKKAAEYVATARTGKYSQSRRGRRKQ